MIETILISMLRKVIFFGLAVGLFKFVDNYYFIAFDTDEAIKNDPKAIAIRDDKSLNVDQKKAKLKELGYQ